MVDYVKRRNREVVDAMLAKAQAALDREQVAFMGHDPDNAKLSAWFNACLNSACGPIAEKFGDAVLAGMLQMWAGIAEDRANKKGVA